MNRSMYTEQIVIGQGGFGRVLSVMIANKALAVKEMDKVTCDAAATCFMHLDDVEYFFL